MTDWVNVLARLALYLDLMLAFGLPFFVLHALRGHERASALARHISRAAVWAAVLGFVLSIAGLVILCKAMLGAESYAEVGRHALEMVIVETDFGTMWLVRMAALAICVVAAIGFKGMARTTVMAVAAAVSLATLAWAGHGAMNEGMEKTLHLATDILHLLAVGAWVGSLAAFLFMLRWANTASSHHVDMLSRALNDFGIVGTVIVLSLIATGIVNYWMIVGATWHGLLSTHYGVLLLVKLALFGAMLGLAAANRYRLSPFLKREKQAGNYRVAMAVLRKSLLAETACAFLILGAVAWLGTLEPMS
jgi:putative copper resistance protein D